MTQSSYNADAIEVLTGLEPVRRRPGMYTDTTRPNHLGQEVIDNSVDEALAGHAKRVEVILHADQSLEVIDDGRGMPVDIHPEEGVPAVELILCRLHAGGKFSNKNYQFSGGLHGVGISVVNALSKRVEVNVRRDGQVYSIAFENGEKVEDLHVTGTCGKRNTGTSVHFWPDESFFDSPRFSVSRLTHLLKAKAVLCPGVEIVFRDQVNNSEQSWCYADGLNDYLSEAVNGLPLLPEKPFVGAFSGETEAVDWALLWLPEGGELLTESYVNLIPTMQGGTHVNGLRQGLLDAMREFCEYRNILAARREAVSGRYLGSLRLRAVGEDAGSAVRRANQRAPVVAPVRGVRLRRGEGRLQPVAESERAGRGAAGGDGHLQRPAPSARGQKSGAQKADQRSGAAG